jgi:hypothetical protein
MDWLLQTGPTEYVSFTTGGRLIQQDSETSYRRTCFYWDNSKRPAIIIIIVGVVINRCAVESARL